MTNAYINRIATAVPAHDVHAAFVRFTQNGWPEGKVKAVFSRLAQRSGIEHRYSVLAQDGLVEADDPAPGIYRRGAFPGTAARMRLYEHHAPELALQALAALDIAAEAERVTHLVVASCTGFMAPGLDQLIARRLGLRPDVQRTLVGFMGCSAAVPALRIAQAAVLANPASRVLVVNLELCTLHMQETQDLEVSLSFLIFGDGCAACLVSADQHGIMLHDFRTTVVPDSEDLITWHIGDQGFVMHLSGQVPARITRALRENTGDLLRGEGTQAIDLWAVHGGGRTILDAVQAGLNLPPAALETSRAVLAAYGNMSSATIMFVLKQMLSDAAEGQRGLAMAFGPGMAVETVRFEMAA
ncbi:MAG TPA: type III polyketide synthase [Acidisoma sp.]|uniref:type III polyketide synthase n=1 Tax=Acidisoma sp. TaxID=1872115 RepID=UPI002CC03A3D|nr:type III polyketide synthase [Acidisoma sp.]HTH99999.1 type III polyketide synthase [Acidisoma sp.]